MDKIKELLNWLDAECPPGTMTFDLSHDFAEKLRNRLNDLHPIGVIIMDKIKEAIDWCDGRIEKHTIGSPESIKALTPLDAFKEVKQYLLSLQSSSVVKDDELESKAHDITIEQLQRTQGQRNEWRELCEKLLDEMDKAEWQSPVQELARGKLNSTVQSSLPLQEDKNKWVSKDAYEQLQKKFDKAIEDLDKAYDH